MSELLSSALAASLLVMVVSTLAGLFASVRGRDRCLQSFEDAQVEAHQGDKSIWGTLLVYGNGIELTYATTHQDTDGHAETSTILYSGEVEALDAIRRYHDQLTERGRQRRDRELQSMLQRSLASRIDRLMRSVSHTFRDALGHLVSSVIGSLSRRRLGTSALGSKSDDLGKVGAEVVASETQRAYDQILERHIGGAVVLEGGDGEELPGVLKEYSERYIELWDVVRDDRLCDLILPRRIWRVRHGSTRTTGPSRA